MQTYVEQIPIELWVSIFSYLEAHDLFQAFGNLNNYFDCLLASNYLLFWIKLRKNDSNSFQCPNGICLSDSVINRTVNLQFLDENPYVYISKFLRLNVDKLFRLQSLSITLPERDIQTISIVLQELNSLRYLYIKCKPNQNLIEAILALSNLLLCKLDLYPSNSTITYTSNKISNIEKLYINFHRRSDHTMTRLLISNMPKLKRLTFITKNSSRRDTNLLFNRQLPIMKHLRIVELTMDYYDITPNYFEYLFHNMPVLKCFYLFTHCDTLNETLIDNLNKYWWSEFENIKKIRFFIRCNHFCGEAKWTEYSKHVDHYQQKLLMMRNRTDTSFNIKIIEQNLETYKWEIMISKS